MGGVLVTSNTSVTVDVDHATLEYNVGILGGGMVVSGTAPHRVTVAGSIVYGNTGTGLTVSGPSNVKLASVVINSNSVTFGAGGVAINGGARGTVQSVFFFSFIYFCDGFCCWYCCQHVCIMITTPPCLSALSDSFRTFAAL